MVTDRDVYVTDANDTPYLAKHVGWRSPTTGNLLRPGPKSEKDWYGDGFEPVYVLTLAPPATAVTDSPQGQ